MRCGCSKAEFDRIIDRWVLKESIGETKTSHPWKVSETELGSQCDKVGVVIGSLGLPFYYFFVLRI